MIKKILPPSSLMILSRNVHLVYIDQKIIVFFKKIALMINLFSGAINELNSNFFAGIYTLTWIDLSVNFIEYINSDHFTGLTNLIKLDLTNNPINKLDLNIFNPTLPVLTHAIFTESCFPTRSTTSRSEVLNIFSAADGCELNPR